MAQATKQKELFDRRAERNRIQIKKKAGDRLRLSVYRSGQHMYAQIIDDAKGVTLAAASTAEKELKAKGKTSTIEAAKKVGALIAERGKKAKVEKVVFDRGGFIYHGRVKALAEAAREGGLQF